MAARMCPPRAKHGRRAQRKPMAEVCRLRSWVFSDSQSSHVVTTCSGASFITQPPAALGQNRIDCDQADQPPLHGDDATDKPLGHVRSDIRRRLYLVVGDGE